MNLKKLLLTTVAISSITFGIEENVIAMIPTNSDEQFTSKGQEQGLYRCVKTIDPYGITIEATSEEPVTKQRSESIPTGELLISEKEQVSGGYDKQEDAEVEGSESIPTEELPIAEKKLSAEEESKILDTLPSKLKTKIGEEEKKKIMISLLQSSEDFRNKLAIILGGTIKELTQKRKDQELGTELSQNLIIFKILEEFALIEAVEKLNMAKKAHDLFGLPISEYMTDGGTIKDEIQVQEEVSKRFNSYRGD